MEVGEDMEKIEFIESYIKKDSDYLWNDNHGELIRCENCKHWEGTSVHELCDSENPDNYCSCADKK